MKYQFKLLNKKGVISKVFVFLFSIIIIVFASFIVTKFIFNFSKNVDNKFQIDFLNKVKTDYASVYKVYGSEKIAYYKVPTKIFYVCFINSPSCVNSFKGYNKISKEVTNFDISNLQSIVSTGDNLILFDKNNVLTSYKIGDYSLENGCFCIKPKLGRFSLVFENTDNKVYISDN